MRIVDVHAHLEHPDFGPDLPEVMRRAVGVGVARIICVGTDVESSRRCVELARGYPGRVRAAVGIHPHGCAEAGPAAMEQIADLAGEREVVAVGETGLDFHRGPACRREQVAAFKAHIRLARGLGKPLIVHSRRADDEVLAALAEDGAGLPGVRHCFDGSAELAERCVRQGLHVSFGALLTRPGHKKTKRAAALVPADRLLVETDCPYQAPASRAGQRNEPALITETVAALAELRGQSPDEIAAVTTANAMRLFFGEEPAP